MSVTQEKAPPAPRPKAHFAKRARFFANRAAQLPGMPALPIVCLAVAAIAATSGAFGTGSLAPIPRVLFWLALMGMEGAKWLAWLAWRVRKREDYWPASLLGTPLLALSLPFEIWLSYWAVGMEPELVLGPTLLGAIPVGLGILAVMAVINPPRWHKAEVAKPTGPLERAGLATDAVLAVSSEDHYCRVFLANSRQSLIAARLADVVKELSPVSGAQIHRCHWVADAGVTAARRAGRGWEVLLPCGTALRVSSTYRKEAKRRGWLARAST